MESWELQNNNENYYYTCVYGQQNVSQNSRNEYNMYTYVPTSSSFHLVLLQNK